MNPATATPPGIATIPTTDSACLLKPSGSTRARGGEHSPYRIFPWGDKPDNAKTNWPNSGDPFETGPFPWTTPVGFYNGTVQKKVDFTWPGAQAQYQTSNGANGYGLHDMSGNVWEWVNDWYNRDYYAMSPAVNPTGPDRGQPMPDGNPYRVLRGGNWYNGEWGPRPRREPRPVVLPGTRRSQSPLGTTLGSGSCGRALGTPEIWTQAAGPPPLANPAVIPARDRALRGNGRSGAISRRHDAISRLAGTSSAGLIQDGDGAVSLDEFLFHEEKKFGRIDRDGNDVLSASEMEADERQQSGDANRGRGNRFARSDADARWFCLPRRIFGRREAEVRASRHRQRQHPIKRRNGRRAAWANSTATTARQRGRATGSKGNDAKPLEPTSVRIAAVRAAGMTDLRGILKDGASASQEKRPRWI